LKLSPSRPSLSLSLCQRPTNPNPDPKPPPLSPLVPHLSRSLRENLNPNLAQSRRRYDEGCLKKNRAGDLRSRSI
ncbi:unnamed protein product, partial [Linum tenue]